MNGPSEPPTGTAPVRGVALLAWCAGAAALAALSLAVHAACFEPGELHVSGNFVDQAGYVTTARRLLDTGELASGIDMPAFLENPRWRPYMPGHYVVLACSYALFGPGDLPSLLPSWGAFVLTCVGVFLLGNRLRGPLVGGLAAFVSAWFPGAVTYAFTAMAESTFTAAGVAALVVVVYLPRRLRAPLAPVLLALPFLFRETGLLWGIPMGLFLLHRGRGAHGGAGRHRLLALAAASVAALAIAFGLNAWQIADGKGSVPLSWVLEGGFDYLVTPRAYAEPVSLGRWVEALGENGLRNARETLDQLTQGPLEPRVLGFWAIVAGAAVSGWVGVRRWKEDPLPLGAALVTGAMLLAIFFLYDVKAQKALRSLLFTVPLNALGVAAAVAGRGAGARRLLCFALPYALAGSWVAGRAGAELVRLDEAVEEARTYVEELPHDDDALLLVDIRLGPVLFDYAVRHYPVPWCFVPGELDALTLLAERHEFGTALLYDPSYDGRKAPRRVLGGRLEFHGRVDLGSEGYLTGRKEYLVYQRP